MNSRMKSLIERRQDLMILVALSLLALITRAYGISEWPIVHDENPTVLHADERYTSWINPAYYVLVVGSFELFGVSEWSARLPAMVLGVLSVPVFYFTWRSVVGRNVALVGALIVILSSWHLEYSQFSRFYSGVFLFGSLSYYFYYKAIQSGSLGYLIWAFLANIVGISFHLTSVMIPASCGLFSLIVLMSSKAAKSDYSRRVAFVHLAVYVTAGLAALSFLWGMAANRAMTEDWGVGPATIFLHIIRDIQLPIALCAFFGMILLFQRDAFKAIFFAIGISIPIAFVVVNAWFPGSRTVYMFYALPLLFLLAAYLCEQVRQSLSEYGLASHALAIVLAVLLMPEMISHYMGKMTLDVREAVAFIKNEYQPGDKILPFPREFYFYGRNEYPVEPRPGNPYVNRKWNQILDPYKEQNPRVWIVLDSARRAYAKKLEAWLLDNATLAWRKHERRYDHVVRGYEVFLVSDSMHRGSTHISRNSPSMIPEASRGFSSSDREMN